MRLPLVAFTFVCFCLAVTPPQNPASSSEISIHTGKGPRFIAVADVNHDSHDRFDSRCDRRLIKRHRCVQPIRIRQRHGGHFLLHCRCDNLLERRYAPQKRIVAMTVQMYEHGCPRSEREEADARRKADVLCLQSG